MSPELERYLGLLEELCAIRRLPGWRPEHDRELLERIDTVFENLDDDDASAAREESWRAFPAKVDLRLEERLLEDFDPDDAASQQSPPRRLAA